MYFKHLKKKKKIAFQRGMNSCHYNRSFHRIPKWQAMRILSGILEGESFIFLATEETPLKGRTRLNMRRHEVEGGSLVSSRLVQWTSNSSGGSREDGKSGKSALVQMKRENQNPRCNPSFQPAIFFFFSLSSLVRLLSALCDLSLPPSPIHSLFLSSSFLRHRTLYTLYDRLLCPVCLRKPRGTLARNFKG